MLLYLLVNGTKPVVNYFKILFAISTIPENAERRHFKIFVGGYEDFEAFKPIPVFNQAI